LPGKPIRTGDFVPSSRFEDIVRLYVFDKKLRLLALDALERIELAVRVDVAHLLGRRDPMAHENPACLHGGFAKRAINRGADKGKTAHAVWLERYRKLVHRARHEPFLEHHQQKYAGKLPIWVAIEVWDFGLLSKLFSGMHVTDKNTIAEKYGATDGEAFSQWLRSLNFIRNVCAHHSRLWNISVLEQSPVPDGWSAGINNKRPFFYFCLMQRMLQTISPNSCWHRRFKALLAQDFPQTAPKQLSLYEFGLVSGWENWGLWQPQ